MDEDDVGEVPTKPTTRWASAVPKNQTVYASVPDVRPTSNFVNTIVPSSVPQRGINPILPSTMVTAAPVTKPLPVVQIVAPAKPPPTPIATQRPGQVAIVVPPKVPVAIVAPPVINTTPQVAPTKSPTATQRPSQVVIVVPPKVTPQSTVEGITPEQILGFDAWDDEKVAVAIASPKVAVNVEEDDPESEEDGGEETGTGRANKQTPSTSKSAIARTSEVPYNYMIAFLKEIGGGCHMATYEYNPESLMLCLREEVYENMFKTVNPGPNREAVRGCSTLPILWAETTPADGAIIWTRLMSVSIEEDVFQIKRWFKLYVILAAVWRGTTKIAKLSNSTSRGADDLLNKQFIQFYEQRKKNPKKRAYRMPDDFAIPCVMLNDIAMEVLDGHATYDAKKPIEMAQLTIDRIVKHYNTGREVILGVIQKYATQFYKKMAPHCKPYPGVQKILDGINTMISEMTSGGDVSIKPLNEFMEPYLTSTTVQPPTPVPLAIPAPHPPSKKAAAAAAVATTSVFNPTPQTQFIAAAPIPQAPPKDTPTEPPKPKKKIVPTHVLPPAAAAPLVIKTPQDIDYNDEYYGMLDIGQELAVPENESAEMNILPPPPPTSTSTTSTTSTSTTTTSRLRHLDGTGVQTAVLSTKNSNKRLEPESPMTVSPTGKTPDAKKSAPPPQSK
jgi:hypothetical protein